MSEQPPRLSQTVAKTLLERSPLHAWHKHRALGGSRVANRAMDTGNLIHESCLGGDKVVVLEFKDWRTNAAKEARDEARADGKVPVLQRDIDAVAPVIKKIRAKLEADGITRENGWRFEERMEWEQDGVLCEGTPDIWGIQDGVLTIIDLKTMKEIPTTNLGHKAAREWAIQCAAYPWGMQTLRPEYAGRIRWRWLLAETDEPHDVRWADPDTELRILGERKWLRALARWRDLLSRGWDEPWESEPVQIQCPAWALHREDEEDFDEAG